MVGGKKLLRKFFIFLIVLVLLWQYLPTLQLNAGFEILLLSAITLTLLDTFLKPLLKAVMIPINMITFGLLSWVAAFLVFFITAQFIDGLDVVDYTIPEIYTDFYVFPQTPVTGLWSYVVTAAFVVILAKFVTWVFKRKSVT